MKTYIKIIITASVTAALTFSATSIFYTAKQFGIADMSSSTNQIKSKLDTVNSYIESDYLYEDVDYEKANDAAIKAYVDSLEEPYTHYYSKDEFKSYLGNIEESYVGIGVIISADTENNKIVVVSPIKGSPAYESGIKPGDYILAVEDKIFQSNGMDECVNMIKSGKEGTKVRITIERNGEVKEYNIERREIVENSVNYEMLEDKIGYISISRFNTNSDGSDESTYTEFVDALSNLEADGMEKLIIDVRDNPGGVLNVVCKIADYLLPEGIITYTETRTGIKDEYKSDKNELNIQMAILINESSASASEILTGALKDYDRATVIGTKSYGKGIVQNVFPFSDGSGMSMTVSKYFTPNGTSIHELGIEPDIVVEQSEEYKDSFVSEIPEGKDTQLNKAIEYLKTEK